MTHIPAHAKAELYGLDAPALVASLYAVDPHEECDLTVFCRNPLHPGPCKGWKKTLQAVAPGVHKLLEDERKRKLAERRKANPPKGRKGVGKGRDGDGDGLKGEGEYVKKGRKKAEPEPDPSDGHPVKLSKETRAKVAAAVKLLPKDAEGWQKLLSEDGPPVRKIDEQVEAAQQKWLAAVLEQIEAENKYWNAVLGKGKGRFDATPEQFDAYRNSSGTKLHDRQIEAAKADFERQRDFRDSVDKKIANGGGVTDGQIVDPNLRHLADYYVARPSTKTEYATDPNGVKVPTERLKKAHQAVQEAGGAIREDLLRSFRDDPELKRIAEELPGLEKIRDDRNNGTPTDRYNARTKIRDNRILQAKREHELTMNALAQLRPMGAAPDATHTDVTPVRSRSELAIGGLDGTANKLARKDWRAQLDSAERSFPTDWNRQSAKVGLTLISSDRAWHRQGRGDWREPNAAARASVLSMGTDKGQGSVSYQGSYDNYVHEVTVHEMGHRMETQIPGIKALEFAYVRSKVTDANGVVEPQISLKKEYGGGYRDGEVAFRDEFPDLYTGKTYENRNNDPAHESWEAFQVGLQQTLGRGDRKFGDDSLEAFTLGVLATVGRS